MFTRDPGDDEESMPDNRGNEQERNTNMKTKTKTKTKNTGAEAPIPTSTPEVPPILPPSPATRRRWHDAESMSALYDEHSTSYEKAVADIAEKRELARTCYDLAALSKVQGVKGVRFTRAAASEVGGIPALTTVHAQLANDVIISSTATTGNAAALDVENKIRALVGSPREMRDPDEIAREVKLLAEGEAVR